MTSGLTSHFGDNNPAELPYQGQLNVQNRRLESLSTAAGQLPGVTDLEHPAFVRFGADLFEAMLNIFRGNMSGVTVVNDQLALNGVPIVAASLFGGPAVPGAPTALNANGVPVPTPGAPVPASVQPTADELMSYQAIKNWATLHGWDIATIITTYDPVMGTLGRMDPATRNDTNRAISGLVNGTGGLRIIPGSHGLTEAERDLTDVRNQMATVQSVYTALQAAPSGDRTNLRDVAVRVINGAGNIVPKADLDNALARIGRLEAFISSIWAKVTTLRLHNGFAGGGTDARAIPLNAPSAVNLTTDEQTKMANPASIA